MVLTWGMMAAHFNPLIAWGVLAAVLLLLCWTAWAFSRRSYRYTVLAIVLASVIALTVYGRTDVQAPPGKNYDLVASFYTGSANVIHDMIDPIVSVGDDLLIAWGVVLAFCAAVLVLLDSLGARRTQPQVKVPPVSKPEAPDPDFSERNSLTEALRFRLPAVSVRKPAVIPGGEKLDVIATMIEASEIKGGKFTAALMRVIHALEPQQRVYETRCFVQRCKQDGQVAGDGDRWRITVDMQDARTGQSIAVKMLPPCALEEAPERVAGFAARQVFRDDPSTPAWAVGSKDGQDLASYLLSCETFAAGQTFRNLRENRREKKKKLEEIIKNSPAPGLIGYDLAAMCDLDGEYLKSLLLHLRNRMNYPRFWAGRYRLAMSLYTLASHIAEDSCDVKDALERQFSAKKDRDELLRRLSVAPTLRSKAMLRRISENDQIDFRDSLAKILLKGGQDGETADAARLALLRLARLELRAYRKAAGVCRALWNAFFRRPLRASLLQALRGNWRVLNPRRRGLTALIAIRAVEASIAIKDQAAVRAIQERASHRLGVCLDKSPKPAKLPKRVPWQAAYNTACLYAMKPYNVSNAITLLHLAIESKECDLEHPSEIIARDADFSALYNCDDFRDFVDDLAKRDFADGEKPETGNRFIDELSGFGHAIHWQSACPRPWKTIRRWTGGARAPLEGR